MKTLPSPVRRSFATLRGWPVRVGSALLWLLALVFVQTAGHAGVGTGGTGAYAMGRVAGVKPLVVNHIRFDDSTAAVVDDDGLPRAADAVRPGMTVEIDSTKVRLTADGATATASAIRTTTELLGALATVDPATGVLGLLGQLVRVDATTVFDDRLSGGLGGLQPGQWLQVSAAYDPASGSYLASRLEPADAAPAFKLRGVVSNIDSNARVLRIGTAEFAYSGVTPPVPLAVGAYVKMQLLPGPVETTRWTVSAFRSATAMPADGREGHLSGPVTTLTSAKLFSVNGQPVNAEGATLPVGGVGVGTRVEVEGRFKDGVLMATQVEAGDDDDGVGLEYESEGKISSVDAAAGTFVLRQKIISTSRRDLRLIGGTLADLAARKKVEVHGIIAPDRVNVEATEIVFKRGR